MFWRRLPTRAWWLGLFLILVLSMAFYLVLVRVTKTTITDQFLKRQQTLGRAQAANVISFFQVIGDSVAVLSQLSSMDFRDARTLRDMDAYVEQRREGGLIGGLILTDSEGVVQFNPNILGIPDLGASVANRGYFIWARQQSDEGAYFISEPVISRLGVSKGQVIVPVSSPVFQNGVFSGVVSTSVLLRPLTESYLELMQISDLTDVYLTNEEGELLYAESSPNMVGSNISDILGDELKEALSKGEEGEFQTNQYLVSYTPIDLGSQNWYLVMTSPTKEILDLAQPFYIRQVAVLLLASLTILTFGVLVMRESQNKKVSQKTL